MAIRSTDLRISWQAAPLAALMLIAGAADAQPHAQAHSAGSRASPATPAAHGSSHTGRNAAAPAAPHVAARWAPRVSPPAPRNWGHYRGGRYWWPAWSAGLYLPVLPWYYDTFWWGGVPFYHVDGSYYRWDDGVRQYAVVPAPDGDAGDWSGVAVGEPYVYPGAGQSSEQLARDRAECARWAHEQSGSDITRGDYRRAETACLKGRGYSVR